MGYGYPVNGRQLTLDEYKQWMCCKENRFCCDECPENADRNTQGSVGPCGQQHCWVDAHCGHID